jgi:hypothetical protein
MELVTVCFRYYYQHLQGGSEENHVMSVMVAVLWTGIETKYELGLEPQNVGLAIKLRRPRCESECGDPCVPQHANPGTYLKTVLDHCLLPTSWRGVCLEKLMVA